MPYPTSTVINMSEIKTFNQGSPSFTNITTSSLVVTSTIDISGSVILKNGNGANSFTNNQLVMHWGGSGYNYAHSIKTRHQGGANNYDNSIDFSLWQTSDGASTIGTSRRFSITNQGVGINITAPPSPLSIVGSNPQIYVNNGTLNNESSIRYNGVGDGDWVLGTNAGGVGSDVFGIYSVNIPGTVMRLSAAGYMSIGYPGITSSKLRVSPTFGIGDGNYIHVVPEATGWQTTRLIGKSWNTYGFTNLDTTEIYTPGANYGSARVVIASSGTTFFNGALGVGRNNPARTIDVAGDIIATSWFRSRGDSGWFSETYGGGWWMTDSTYVRSYNNKSVWMDAGWVTTDGRIGTGTSVPSFPLHVTNFVNSQESYRYFNYSAITAEASGNNSYSVRTVFATVCPEFDVYSDQRIKTNIIDINDTSALSILRQIEPKQYTYKNTIKKGTEPVWGFIAQQVESVLEYSVSKLKDFIPDIYDKASIYTNNNSTGSIITLSTKTTTSLNTTENCTLPLKIRLYFDHNEQDTERDVTLKSIIDNNRFEIEEHIEDVFKNINGNIQSQHKVFVYGKKVDDYRALNKDAIFTIATAALQEVDRELQTTIQSLDILESQLNNITLDTLETNVNNAMQQLGIVQ
jgi:hypothetical protein